MVPSDKLVTNWFQTFFMFTPKIGEDFPFDEHIFRWVGSTTNQLSMKNIHPGSPLKDHSVVVDCRPAGSTDEVIGFNLDGKVVKNDPRGTNIGA